jgi:hypothetical protein
MAPLTDLSEIHGFNKYCGPSVLSALTGKSTDVCASVISQVSGQRIIKAVNIDHLLMAVRILGFEVKKLPAGGTVFGTISLLSRDDGFYILLVPHHVVALEVRDKKIYLIDNHTKTAISASSSARLTQLVQGAWNVKPKDKQTIAREAIELRIRYLKERLVFAQSQIDKFTAEKIQLELELNEIQGEIR